MAKGGYRPNAGRPKGAKNKATIGLPRDIRNTTDIATAAHKSGLSPLDYMLSVMRDDTIDGNRRDRMAVAAAPFVHSKAEAADGGKKAQKQASAEKAANGKFAPRTGPRLAVDNG